MQKFNCWLLVSLVFNYLPRLLPVRLCSVGAMEGLFQANIKMRLFNIKKLSQNLAIWLNLGINIFSLLKFLMLCCFGFFFVAFL